MNFGTAPVGSLVTCLGATLPLLLRAGIMAEKLRQSYEQEGEAARPRENFSLTSAQRTALNSVLTPRVTLVAGLILGTLPGSACSVLYNGLNEPGTVASESAVFFASSLASSLIAAGELSLFQKSRWAIQRSKNPATEILPLLLCCWGAMLVGAAAYILTESYLR